METYNGHKSWDHWNVSLWIFNDYGLYSWAGEKLKEWRDPLAASSALFDEMQAHGITETPDGAKFSIETINAALEDF